MRYIWLRSNALLSIIFCGLAISAIAQTVPSGRRISATCRYSSNPYCKQSPIPFLDADPELRTQLDSLIGKDLYTCARSIAQVAEFGGALYPAIQDSGKAALPIAAQAFEPLKVERVYSRKIPGASGNGFYIVVRLKSDLLGAVQSDAHPGELRSSQDPMFSLLRNMADHAYSDLAKAPFTQGEIDSIEQHHVEVGTTETVAHCALGTPLDRASGLMECQEKTQGRLCSANSGGNAQAFTTKRRQAGAVRCFSPLNRKRQLLCSIVRFLRAPQVQQIAFI